LPCWQCLEKIQLSCRAIYYFFKKAKLKGLYQKEEGSRIKKTGSTKRGRAGQKRRDEEHFICCIECAISSRKRREG
jgi:hypothetical protein